MGAQVKKLAKPIIKKVGINCSGTMVPPQISVSAELAHKIIAIQKIRSAIFSTIEVITYITVVKCKRFLFINTAILQAAAVLGRYDMAVISKLYHGPRYLRDRAEECRTMAESMNDEGSKKMCLDLANGYERAATMADTLERQLSELLTQKPPHH
jgi:hypothetical protein